MRLIKGLSGIWKARPKPKTLKHQQLEAIAGNIYQDRLKTGAPGNEREDWEKAVSIHSSPARLLLFRINQPLIKAEKGVMEPVADWLDRADLFRIIERISPAIEALGVLAIPLVLFFATQGYQERIEWQASEQRQQQAVKDYLGQLSTLLLDVSGDLRDPQNVQLRTLTEATTLAFLDEPNLDSRRKGQVINFLSQMRLVNREIGYGPMHPEDKKPTLGLRGANLSDASLFSIYLQGVDLRGANLQDATLSHSNIVNADLSLAYLRDADLSEANLSNTNLDDANLRNADLSEANLSFANLSFANLDSADMRGADVRGANLSFANLDSTDMGDVLGLAQEQLREAFLCKTKLPIGINLNPDRDCL